MKIVVFYSLESGYMVKNISACLDNLSGNRDKNNGFRDKISYSSQLQKPKLLVIDDEESICFGYQSFLRKKFSVDVYNPTEHKKTDLGCLIENYSGVISVISDWMMSWENGEKVTGIDFFKAFHNLYTNRPEKEPVYILLTGNYPQDNEISYNGRKDTIPEYLNNIFEKPVGPSKLSAILDDIIKN